MDIVVAGAIVIVLIIFGGITYAQWHSDEDKWDCGVGK